MCQQSHVMLCIDCVFVCVAAKPQTEAVDNDTAESTASEHLSMIMAVALLSVVLLLLALCFVVYYRRRYKRLKHTTELVVQFTRADMGDPGTS